MASKLEKLYLNAVASLGCIACKGQGYEDSPAEIHHLRFGQGMSDRAKYWLTIGLCTIHHRTGDGKESSGLQIGFHKDPAEFEKRYGTEMDLFNQVHNLLPPSLLHDVQLDINKYNERSQIKK